MKEENACKYISECFAYNRNYEGRGHPFPIMDRTVCSNSKDSIEAGNFCLMYDLAKIAESTIEALRKREPVLRAGNLKDLLQFKTDPRL